jgi:hypothetical protein
MRIATPTGITATTNGTIAVGDTLKVVFIFSSDFAGTVLGLAFAGANDAELTLEAEDLQLAAIPYTISAGSARIIVYRRTG